MKSWPIRFNRCFEVSLLNEAYLRGMLTAISKEIGTEATLSLKLKDKYVLFQSFEHQSQEKNIVCEHFMNATNSKYCKDVIKTVSSFLYRNKTIDKLTNNLQEEGYLKEIKSSDTGQLYQLRKMSFDRLITFDCPIFKFQKFFFPIFLDDGLANTIIGFLFAGRCKNSYNSKNLIEAKDDFFEKSKLDLRYPKLSQNLEELLPKISGKKVLYSEKIRKGLIENGKKLNEHFEQLLNTKKEEYIDKHVQRYLDIIAKKAPIEIKGDPKEITQLWNVLVEVIQDIKDTFSIKHICAFGSEDIEQTEVQFLDVIALSKNHIINNKARNKIKYDLSKIGNFKDIKRQILTSSLVFRDISGYYDGKLLFKGLEKHFPGLVPSQNHIRLLKTSQHNIIVIWSILNREKWDALSFTNKNRKVFEKKICSVYSEISVRHVAIINMILRKSVENNLAVSSHETLQPVEYITLRKENFISRLINIKNVHGLNKFKQEKIALFNSDIDKALTSLYDYAIRGLLISRPIVPNKDWFYPFTELLNEWRNAQIFNSGVGKRNTKIVVPDISIFDESRPKIYADKDLIRNVISNFISNALKYSHNNTKIHLDYRKRQGYGVFYCKNYGVKIENSDLADVYKHFFQGSNNSTQGFGIGLYVIKKIITAHNGLVDIPTCKLISRYNIGFLNAYVRNVKITNKKKKGVIKYELYRLQKEMLYEDIINSTNFKSYREEIEDNVGMPTYKVVFRVRIPLSRVRIPLSTEG